MRKTVKTLLAIAVGVLGLSQTVYAGEWKQNNRGWWWQEDDGSYARDGWQWLDGNGDGTAECYYFYSDGYMAEDTIAEGYRVDKNGCWVQQGQVQTKSVQQDAGQLPSEQVQTEENQQPESSKGTPEAQSPADRFQEAVLGQREDSADLAVKMNFSASSQGITLEGSMDGTMKYRGFSGTNPEYLMDMNLSFLGQQVQERCFYTGGYYYVEVGDQKYRMQMDLGDALEQTQAGSLTEQEDLSLIRDLTEERHEDGSVTYRYTIDSGEMNDMMAGIIGDMTSAGGMSMSVKSYEVELTLNSQGLLTEEKLRTDMTMTVDDMTMDMYMDITISENNPGQAVVFELPSTEGYQEI